MNFLIDATTTPKIRKSLYSVTTIGSYFLFAETRFVELLLILSFLTKNSPSKTHKIILVFLKLNGQNKNTS